MILCEVCRSQTPVHRSVHVTERGDLCFTCFNEEMAARMGVDFDNARLPSVVMKDATGESHAFDIVSRFCATGHAMDAVEVREGEARGYSFSVLGDFEIDAMALFGELYERMRQGLATRYVRRGELGWQLTEDDRLAGRIEWDDATNGEVPLLVIDGETFTWDQVGKMLMTYEGFVVEMKVRGHIETVSAPLRGRTGGRRDDDGSPAEG